MENMDQPDEASRRPALLPRFSIRALLGVLTICAVAFLVAGMAYRGQYWAWGVTIGLFSFVLTALVHAAWFGMVWLFAEMSSTRPGDTE
jgi:hypothetical protein